MNQCRIFILVCLINLFTLLTCPRSAHADFEDDNQIEFSEEQLLEAPFSDDYNPPSESDSEFADLKGNWAYEFRLIHREDMTAVRLSHSRENVSMIPASTLKVFTGYFGYLKKFDTMENLSHMLHVSDNEQANQVFKKGRGQAAMIAFYQSIGLFLPSSFQAFDGCGEDIKNRTTAHTEVELMETILKGGHYDDFKIMLATPDTKGTLKHEKRYQNFDYPIYAKTGTFPLTGIASLTGFVELGSRDVILFSIISNPTLEKSKGHAELHKTMSIDRARALIDATVAAVTENVVQDSFIREGADSEADAY